MGDHQMVPVRGQTVTVRAPWIRNFYTFDSNYIYPRYDGSVVLGNEESLFFKLFFKLFF